MKNILYVCPTSGIGGAETFLKKTWEYRNSTQFNNIYLFFSEGCLPNELRELGAEVHILAKRPRLSKPADWLRTRNAIKSLIDKKKISLTHSTMAYAALFTAMACRNSKHLWFQHGPASGWMDQLASLLPHQGVIFNSQYISQKQKNLEKKIAPFVPNRKELILPLGSDTFPQRTNDASFKKELLQKHSAAENAMVISMLCRIQPQKGVHILLEAIKELQKENFPRKIHAFVWGEAFKGEEYMQTLIQEADKHQLPISFPGKTHSATQVLAASDILVNASIKPEAFGLTVVEAMGAGVPPIAPFDGGPKEIIEDGVTGLFFEVANPQSLAEKIKILASDTSLYQKIAESAAKAAKSQFRIQDAIKKMEEFYLELLEKE